MNLFYLTEKGKCPSCLKQTSRTDSRTPYRAVFVNASVCLLLHRQAYTLGHRDTEIRIHMTYLLVAIILFRE